MGPDTGDDPALEQLARVVPAGARAQGNLARQLGIAEPSVLLQSAQDLAFDRGKFRSFAHRKILLEKWFMEERL